ncbi:hypothetical protein [Candidatus Vondammii sp. HM_W22]|uniref:hypothetical protein n=1 Tax=Candidatus Vondammii sp. HM_W22 TaxID=2687299 RepID=UPI001F14717B|nr:hypothetical protein [Candidatus Vondammii sp. HM_W22]
MNRIWLESLLPLRNHRFLWMAWRACDCVNGSDVVHAVAEGYRVAENIKIFVSMQKVES